MRSETQDAKMDAQIMNSENSTKRNTDTFSIDPQLIDILQTANRPGSLGEEIGNAANKPLEELPLNEFISLVLKERDITFKDLTAERLMDEASEDVNMEEEDDNILVENPENSTLTLEQFDTLKKESLQFINNAINESSLLLEMVSLLISGVKPKQGVLTMSPFLKQHLPLGSLNSDSIPMKQILNNDIVKNFVIKMAWKLQSLNDMRAYYYDTFQRLNKEILIENKYWSLISDSKLNGKNSFVKNSKTNTISLKYGINGNQLANLVIVDYNFDSFEIQLSPSINAHKLLVSSDAEENYEQVIFKYVKVEVYDGEKNILKSQSKLANSVVETLRNSLLKNNLVDQLNRLNEFQIQELLFNTLKHEGKENMGPDSGMSLKSDTLIEIQTNGNFHIKIKYESLTVKDLDIVDVNDGDSKLADDILKFMLTNLFYLNNLRSYNNIIKRPIYYSKKSSSQKGRANAPNYHNIISNLLLKLNHKYLIKSFVDLIEKQDGLVIKNLSTKDDDTLNTIPLSELDTPQLKSLKMKLNSFTPLISNPTSLVTVGKGEKEYHVKVTFTSLKAYTLVLESDNKKNFNNIHELLDYLLYISI